MRLSANSSENAWAANSNISSRINFIGQLINLRETGDERIESSIGQQEGQEGKCHGCSQENGLNSPIAKNPVLALLTTDILAMHFRDIDDDASSSTSHFSNAIAEFEIEENAGPYKNEDQEKDGKSHHLKQESNEKVVSDEYQ